MIKKLFAIVLFGMVSFCMIGTAPADEKKPLKCPATQYVCGRTDYTMCCDVGTWCCQYQNSPQFYCSKTKKCEYGDDF